MTIGWALLLLFLIGYAALAIAALWHLETYSFSRSARTVGFLFTIAALILASGSIIFFASLDWQALGGTLQAKPNIEREI